MVPFILTYDIDQGHDLYKITFWAVSQLLLVYVGLIINCCECTYIVFSDLYLPK